MLADYAVWFKEGRATAQLPIDMSINIWYPALHGGKADQKTETGQGNRHFRGRLPGHREKGFHQARMADIAAEAGFRTGWSIIISGTNPKFGHDD
jgi:hypothetical protein